jgi:hypothetical protein
LLLTGGILIQKFLDTFWNDFNDFISYILIVIGFAGTLLIGLLWPSEYYSKKMAYEGYKSFIETVESYTTEEIERAGLSIKIAEYNKDLAEERMWADTWLSDLYPESLSELHFIRINKD